MVESWWWTMNILPEWMFVLLALSARLGQGRPASNYSEGRASHSFYTTLGHLKLQGTHRESLHTLHTSHNVPVWENDDISSDKTVGGEGQVKTDTITADLSLLSTQARNCKQELRAGSKTLVQSSSKTRSNQYLITRILFQNRALLGVMLQPAMTGGCCGGVISSNYHLDIWSDSWAPVRGCSCNSTRTTPTNTTRYRGNLIRKLFTICSHNKPRHY